MGVQSLVKSLVSFFPSLAKPTAPESNVVHYECVDCYEDVMTRLYMLIGNGTPVTGKQLYDRFIEPHRRRILYRQRKSPEEIDLTVVCFDKEKYKPSAKHKLQTERDKIRGSTMYNEMECYYIDDDGIRSMWDASVFGEGGFSDLGLTPEEEKLCESGEPQKIDVERLLSTRSVRQRLFEYFWDKLVADDSWPPNTRFVFDFHPTGPFVLDIDADANRSVSRLEANYIGEAENALIYHVRRNWLERKPERLAFFTTDQDLLALLLMHFWHADLSAVKQFTWYRGRYFEVYVDILQYLKTLRRNGWGRHLIGTLSCLSGTDYCEKVDGVGLEKMKDRFRHHHRNTTPETTKQLSRLKGPISYIEYRKLARQICQGDPLGVGAMYDAYCWQIKYWMKLYDEDMVINK